MYPENSGRTFSLALLCILWRRTDPGYVGILSYLGFQVKSISGKCCPAASWWSSVMWRLPETAHGQRLVTAGAEGIIGSVCLVCNQSGISYSSYSWLMFDTAVAVYEFSFMNQWFGRCPTFEENLNEILSCIYISFHSRQSNNRHTMSTVPSHDSNQRKVIQRAQIWDPNTLNWRLYVYKLRNWVQEDLVLIVKMYWGFLAELPCCLCIVWFLCCVLH